MKNRFYNLLVLLAATTVLHAQETPSRYQMLVLEADSLMAQQQYLPAAHKYSAAFESFGWKGYTSHRYDAARCWAMADVPDSAFFNLDRIVAKAGFKDFGTLQQDTAFVSLRSDSRWTELVKMTKKNSGIDEATFDPVLFALIDSLAREDQKWRQAAMDIQNSGHVDSVQLARAFESMRWTDSMDYFVLLKIIDEHGFPDYDKVGVDGTHYFWLLMQHQDRHPDFQERVLQMMEVAVGQKKASGSDYAYLLDRVMINTGKLQVYGTQMTLNADSTSFEPKPCIEPENLDKRRESVGLGTIERYIYTMNHVYHGSLKSKNR